MKKHYDFSKGTRGAVIPTNGKTRITIYLDDRVFNYFKEIVVALVMIGGAAALVYIALSGSKPPRVTV